MERVFTNQKRSTGVSVGVLDKVHFSGKNIARYKEGHFIMLKSLISQEDITIQNVFARNSSFKIHGDGTVRRNRKIHNYRWILS